MVHIEACLLQAGVYPSTDVLSLVTKQRGEWSGCANKILKQRRHVNKVNDASESGLCLRPSLSWFSLFSVVLQGKLGVLQNK